MTRAGLRWRQVQGGCSADNVGEECDPCRAALATISTTLLCGEGGMIEMVIIHCELAGQNCLIKDGNRYDFFTQPIGGKRRVGEMETK